MLYYYVLLDPDKPYQSKVGITKDPKQRLRAYKTQCPRCTMHKTWKIPTKVIERDLLNLFKEAHFIVEREVVFTSALMIERIVDGYIVDHDLEVC